MARNGIRHRWLLLLLAAVVGMLAGSVVAATPAAAGVLGLQLVMDVTASNSTDKKVMGVPCPRGKMIVSGGAYVDGAEGEVKVDRLRPVFHGHYFEAAASEWARRTDRSWRLHVYAICAYPTPGLVHVAARSKSYDSPLRTAVADCPPGKQLIGFGGAAAVEFDRRVVLSVVLPSADLTRVVVQSWQELDGEPADWTAEAYAVCVDPVPGMFLAQNSPPPSSLDKAVGVDCGGKQLHAVGSGIFSGGRAGFTGIYPGAAPILGGTAITKEDPTGVDGDWYVYTAGICG